MDGQTVTLLYLGWLPPINGHQVHRLARSRLTRAGRRAFGTLPPFLQATRKAHMTITRVLGWRQKEMDDDSIALLTGGLRDSLKPSYLVDDSPTWLYPVVYRNDGTRRTLGPGIEITITYEE